jgi:hypothetical protein
MPFAVALLCHPAGAYACLVTTLAAVVYAWHTRRFVPSFTAASAGALTTLAFLQVPPDASDVALVGLGIALLQLELVLPTYGAALVAGCATTVTGGCSPRCRTLRRRCGWPSQLPARRRWLRPSCVAFAYGRSAVRGDDSGHLASVP